MATSPKTSKRPHPRTGSMALEASYVVVDLSSFDFGPYRFEGSEPLGALTDRMMHVDVLEDGLPIAQRRVPMHYDNTEGLHEDDLAELRLVARAMREELIDFARQRDRTVVSMARARTRRHHTLQLATRR